MQCGSDLESRSVLLGGGTKVIFVICVSGIFNRKGSNRWKSSNLLKASERKL